MSAHLHTAMKAILAMPYYKNEHARSGQVTHGHETAVAQKLLEAGFEEISNTKYKITKKIIKNWIKTKDDFELRKATNGLASGSYIVQPASSQSYPDILVKDFNDRFICIECKSGKGAGAPMWNDSLPRLDGIYVFASQKRNATTIALGKDIISQDLINSAEQMMNELKEVVEKYKNINKEMDVFKRGWSIKFRPQNFQGGKKTMSSYFEHPDRLQCEQNVLQFAEE